ncbi:uncharacterized protein BDZ99DRAFT_530943 [Mytilinidion resinicola]|uniref:Rhodopsin domain-containing protein n=1 Tax=Mytilinidion resinicola TaxID=574789 RepID=A0A6A6ZC19_9PEZI|nr:uncharacterized protein BDZ99DRAFT_530943 [Mytilinidion resinicola]KAF2817767.1 hypothetical protein BDZ99DRAFT_530943 [Mytilinidion resinicola]
MVVASILFILYSALVTVSTENGLGQPLSHILNQSSYAKAIKYVIIAQAVFLAAIAVASSAVAIFLLRLVVNKWQRGLLWSCIISHCIFNTLSILAVYLQCSPVDRLWDRQIPGAKCWKNAHALNYLASLLFRTGHTFVGVAYTHLAIWSSTELFCSMVFASIPILRLLYMAVVHGTYENASKSSSQRSRGYPLRDYGNHSTTNKSSLGAATTVHTAVRFQPHNASEESILGAPGKPRP